MKIKLLFLILLVSTAVFSQNKTADSLVIILNKSKNDLDKATLLNAIATAYMSSDPKLMQDYAAKALDLSQKIKFKIEEGNAYLNLGNASIIQGNYPVALENFLNAQTVFESQLNTDAAKNESVKNGLARS